MNSPLMESLGLGGLDSAWLFLGIFALLLALTVLWAALFAQYRQLKKRCDRFMKGKDAKSLENKIASLFEENGDISDENKKNGKEIREIQRQMAYCYQKMGLVKYDAFKQMGGQLSFCLALLDHKNNGFLINSVHSTDGCYSYVKEIKKGESEIALGEEEKQALEEAMQG